MPSRYGARIEKSLNFNLEQLRVRRNTRIGKRGDQYDERICPPSDWYREQAGLAQALVKAREEIQAKSASEVTPPEP